MTTPDNTWSINGFSARLRRGLSITFSVDAEITGLDILEAFMKANVDPDHIASIQYRNLNCSWVVSFTDQQTKEFILEAGHIKIKEFLVFLGDADLKTVIVKIYEAPPEMPDTVVIGRLSHYGCVLSFRRDRGVATRILNGARTARMCLSKTIPSSVRIAGEAIGITNAGQPKTCRKCGDKGHLASGCKNPRCYNCESPGHRAADCDKQPFCGICLDSKHPMANCPFLLFSVNVSNVEEDANYADAVKADSVARVWKNISKEPVSSETCHPPADKNARSECASGQEKAGKTMVRTKAIKAKVKRKVAAVQAKEAQTKAVQTKAVWITAVKRGAVKKREMSE